MAFLLFSPPPPPIAGSPGLPGSPLSPLAPGRPGDPESPLGPGGPGPPLCPRGPGGPSQPCEKETEIGNAHFPFLRRSPNSFYPLPLCPLETRESPLALPSLVATGALEKGREKKR